MGDVAGTPRKCMINGISFDVMADTDITQPGGKFLNESISTSGRNLRKMTKRSQTREGLVIACNPSEAAILKGFADSVAKIPLSYTLADGSKYTSPGWIEFESVTSMDNKGTIKLHEKEDWELFVAQ